MKKLFIFIVIFLLSLTFVKSYADCPSGYTEYSYNTTYVYTYPSGGGTFTCHINVVYCCKWDNTLKEVVMEMAEVRPQTSGDNCMNYIPDINDFFSYLHEETAKQAQSSCAPLFPPCDDENNPFYLIKEITAQCWYYKNLILYEGDDIYSTVLRKCPNSVTCEELWKACFDYNYTPPKLILTFVSKLSNGTPNCALTIPTLPPAGKTWEEPWESDCFSAACN